MNTLKINKLKKLVADYQSAAQGQVDLKKFTYYAHSTALNKVEAKTFQLKGEAVFNALFQFVGIYPFVDGNGRISRLIMNYIVACFDLPIFHVYKSNRISYIQTLKKELVAIS